MNCVKCGIPIKSKGNCVVAYEYGLSIIFHIPPQLTVYHKNCFNEHKIKSGITSATVDLTQLKKLKDSSFKLLIFWVIIGIIPLVLFVALLIQSHGLDESFIVLFLSIFPSLFIYLYASRLKKIKEIENLPATQK